MKTDSPDSGAMSLSQSQMRALLDLVLDRQASNSDAIWRRIDAQVALSDLGARAGEPTDGVLDRLADEALPVAELRTFKDLAKRLMASADASAREREAAQLLYHAATAAALCVNGSQISSEPLRTRREVYLRFAAVLSGDPLGDIFARAAAWTLLIDTSE